MFWLLLGCSVGEPPAGTLREDLEGLGDRTRLPPNVASARWLTQAGESDRVGGGRGDARLVAWVAVPGGATEWLGSTVGQPIGPRAHWVSEDVARTLLTTAELSVLQYNPTRKSWKLACVRYPGLGLGLRDYSAGVVLECGDHLYLALSAR